MRCGFADLESEANGDEDVAQDGDKDAPAAPRARRHGGRVRHQGSDRAALDALPFKRRDRGAPMAPTTAAEAPAAALGSARWKSPRCFGSHASFFTQASSTLFQKKG